MSTGLRHEQVARWLPVASCAVALVVALRVGWRLPVACIAGQLVGVYMLTPDSDIHSLSRGEIRWFREPRKGSASSWLAAFLKFPVGIAALVMGWLPGLFLRHRGISHVPVVGAAVIALLVAANPIMLMLFGWRWALTPEAMAAWVGFCMAHAVHITMDRFGK